MKANKIVENIIFAGTFSFLILISIDGLTTNYASRLFTVSIRYASIIVLILASILLHLKEQPRRGWKNHFSALILYLLLVAWGVALALANGVTEIGWNELFLSSLVVIFGAMLFVKKGKTIIPPKMAEYYVLYTFIGLFVTLWVDGFELSFPPRFVFDYLSDRENADILYSQGASKYFGVGAIAAIFITLNSKTKIKGYGAFVFAAIFISLSILGGARGDSVLAALVIIFFLLIRKAFHIFFWLLALSLVLYLSVNDWAWMDGILTFQRLSFARDGDFGQRDVLLTQVVELLANQSRCLFFGCGFGYFQNVYGYDYGLYPHNILAEMLIIFGLPLTGFLIFTIGAGLRAYWQKTGLDLFILLFFYNFLISLKSGSFFGGWFLTASCIYFLSIYLQRKTRGFDQHECRESIKS